MESRGGVLCNVSESVRFWLLADLFERAALRPLSDGKQTFWGYTAGLLSDRSGMLDLCLKILSALNAEKPSPAILTETAGAKPIRS